MYIMIFHSSTNIDPCGNIGVSTNPTGNGRIHNIVFTNNTTTCLGDSIIS